MILLKYYDTVYKDYATVVTIGVVFVFRRVHLRMVARCREEIMS